MFIGFLCPCGALLLQSRRASPILRSIGHPATNLCRASIPLRVGVMARLASLATLIAGKLR
jgi:hypothetical protein